MNGFNNCITFSNDVSYAKINADGSLSNWVTTTTFTTGRSSMGATVYNGSMYIFQGCSGGDNGKCIQNGTLLSDTQYAPIYANGAVGTWQLTTVFGSVRASHKTVVSDGYMFNIGGCTANTCTSTNIMGDTQSTKVDPSGVAGPYTDDTTHVVANARYGTSSVAYNGYLYVIGGCTAGNCTAVSNKVSYAAIGSTGTLGSFTDSANNLVGARYGHASFAYNGRLYVVGGCSSTTTTCSTFSNSIQYSGTITSGNPAARNTAFARSLCMASADASTPEWV